MVLVFFALGRREAVIVGAAVLLTLAATLFASWAWGFTLNRVSLFALIFSIGILVDDAIVVVENIHRRRLLDAAARAIIPSAVDEVGGPTILATFTVIAALLPMAFVSGLMGPYMSPIPINASMGMLISLAIAFIVHAVARAAAAGPSRRTRPRSGPRRLDRIAERLLAPFVTARARRGSETARCSALRSLAAIVLSVSLAGVGLVVLKMLPFDNKSEFQVVVDMPAGTPVESHRRGVARDGRVPRDRARGDRLPGLCRGRGADQLQRPGAAVLPARGRRTRRHPGEPRRQARIATARATRSRRRCARDLEAIGARWNAKVKVVEVPPGPPVLAPIVAEVYGPDEGRPRARRNARARRARRDAGHRRRRRSDRRPRATHCC